jgi:hydrogenase nickel incorporation protein HypB
MCKTCGCGADNVRIEKGKKHSHKHTHNHGETHSHEHDHDHDHAHDDDHNHDHDHDHSHKHDHHHDIQSRTIKLERALLAKNDEEAEHNRKHLREKRVLALNLVSSPGSGKTTLLCETIKALKGKIPMTVIEGDQETSADAERIRATGIEAIQVNTGKGCHLDASMVHEAMHELDIQENSVLFIENVGNLVCPAEFDLGEAYKIAIVSVTEGEDKPLKYPTIFARSNLVIVNKVDLLPHLDFNVDELIRNARRVKPGVEVIRLSARTGEGMNEWTEWIRRHAP